MLNDYTVQGDITVIYLNYRNRKMATLIDTVDLEKAMTIKGNVRAHFSGLSKEKFYTHFHDGTKNILFHRFLMDFPEGLVVDHINDNSLDNRRSTNLQAITNGENVRKQNRDNREYLTLSRRLKRKLERDQAV